MSWTDMLMGGRGRGESGEEEEEEEEDSERYSTTSSLLSSPSSDGEYLDMELDDIDGNYFNSAFFKA